MQKVKIALTIEMVTEVPIGMDKDQIEFYFQESGCLTNLLDQLYQEIDESSASSTCCICYRAEAKVLEIINDK